jgi:hypothetical protein
LLRVSTAFAEIDDNRGRGIDSSSFASISSDLRILPSTFEDLGKCDKACRDCRRTVGQQHIAVVLALFGVEDIDNAVQSIFVKSFGRRQAYENPRCRKPQAAGDALWEYRFLAGSDWAVHGRAKSRIRCGQADFWRVQHAR